MLAWIEFENYKALRNCRLPLDRITVLVGANGSGKSTVLEAFRLLQTELGRGPRRGTRSAEKEISVQARSSSNPRVLIKCALADDGQHAYGVGWWQDTGKEPLGNLVFGAGVVGNNGLPDPNLSLPQNVQDLFQSIRVFSFDPREIAKPCQIAPDAELQSTGANLVAVLDALDDNYRERFDELNSALHEWLPDFDCVQFDPLPKGRKILALRTAPGGHKIRADSLSDGTLIALCLLTLAYLPDPPRIIGIEEPDHSLHPRLLVQVHDALVRLAYPEEYGEQRDPVQVIATTHSPYFLDLFKTTRSMW